MSRFRKLQRKLHDATLHIHGSEARILAGFIETICMYLAEDEEPQAGTSEDSETPQVNEQPKMLN